MADFTRLRKELEIESRDERTKRLRRLGRQERKMARITRRILRKLRDELFPDSRIRPLEDGGGVGIVHYVSAQMPGGAKKRRRRVRDSLPVYDVGVRFVLDSDALPRRIVALVCWRELASGAAVPLANDPGGDPSGVTIAPEKDALIATLIDLVREYPPGR